MTIRLHILRLLLLVISAGWCLGLGAADSVYQQYRLFGLLDKMVQPIDTVTYVGSTTRQYQRGIGFILGQSLVTTADQVAWQPNSLSYLRGNPLWKGVRFPDLDIVVLDLPEAVCATMCNQVAVADRAIIVPGLPVAWMHKITGQVSVRHAHIVAPTGANSKPDQPGLCSRDQWILVDQPFQAESIGAPIVATETGVILGIALENRAYSEGEFGAFMSFDCLTVAVPESMTSN